MLKLFYKSFFVAVLCGSLLLLDFSYKGMLMNAAQAESVKTDKINDSNLMGTLTMTVVGTLAKRLYSYKMTTDIMLAAAGGATFIGGEVLAYLKLKDVMEDMEVQITRDKQGNINKEQIESLERLKKSYIEAKKTAETKKTLQMASAVAFAAAAVTAYTMAGVETAQLSACTGSIPGVISQASAQAKACSTGGCSAPYIACANSASQLSSAIAEYELKKQATGPSSSCLSAYTSANAELAAKVTSTSSLCSSSGGGAISNACNVKLATDMKDSSGGTSLAVPEVQSNNPIIKKLLKDQESAKLISQNSSAALKNSFHNLLSKALDFIMPQAEAALFSAMGIASSAAVSFLLYTQAELGPKIDMYMLIPQNRAIVWGILAGLTYSAISATDNVISQIDSNISKIDAILNSMYQMANGATGTQVAQSQAQIQTTIKPSSIAQFNANNYTDIDLKKNGEEPLPCFTGNDPKKCKSFDESLKDVPSFEALNNESQKQLKSIMNAANGLNGTSKITSGTIQGLSTIAGSASATRILLDKASKKYAENLKNSGSKINPEEQTKKFSDSVTKSINDALKKSNATPTSMYASMYGGKSAISSSASTTSAADEAAKKAAAEAASEAARRAAFAAQAGNVIDIGSTNSEEKADLGLENISTTQKELSAEELAKLNADQKAAAGKTLDAYDLKNDISTDKTTSLFELISNRYQQSGYPRLFKKKDIKEEEAAIPLKK